MTYQGLNAADGRQLADLEHIRQSIRDILTTPIGTRVMRRAYGSMIPDLIDQPLHGATLLRLSAATYVAMLRWEPRVRITRARFAPDATQPGRLVLDLTLLRTDEPSASPTDLAIPLMR